MSRLREVQIAIVGDFDPALASHPATDDALWHAAAVLEIVPNIDWLPTASLARNARARLKLYDAVLSAPGSPYRSLNGALDAIRWARESKTPWLGTCGGFQHAVIEFARNVLNFEDAQHAEYDPAASRLLITRLGCSLAGKTLPIALERGSKTSGYYGAVQVAERYHCSFGLNPDYQPQIASRGFRVVGQDQGGEARILELDDHPFFVATLFVPQLQSTRDAPHPLVLALLQSAVARRTTA